MFPTTFPAATGQAIEHRKSPLLALVQTVIERICGSRQCLQGGAASRERCGPLTQALDRIVARRRIARGIDAVEAELAKVACSLLERRPVFLLLRRERKPRFERRQARFAEGAQIL